ncbi:unnamed protein product [Musa textilis]
MKKRWARAALVACLILFFADSRGCARRINWKHTHHRHKAKEKTSAMELGVDAATIHRHGCRLKRNGIDLCGRPLTQPKKNGSLVDEDKRLVPTGPNPLHNR